MQHVVIIGAGPAGLSTAYELLKHSAEYDVTILEESEALGGISRTVKCCGQRMDIGGHRFFTKEPRVMDFWKEILPVQGKPAKDDIFLARQCKTVPGGPNPETEDDVMLIRRRVSRIYYKGKFFDYPISFSWKTIRNLGFFTTIAAGFSYLWARIRKKPETNLENFYINRFGKKLYSMFFEGYTQKLWGRHPINISAEWGAQRVKGLSISAIIADIFRKIFKKNSKTKETSLIEEFYYPKFGPGQLWEAVADEISDMGGRIHFGERVSKVNTQDKRVISVETANGITVPCDILVSSMPVKDLMHSIDTSPDDIRDYAENLPYRDFITIGILVNELGVKNTTNIKTLNDIVPDCWIYVQDLNMQLGRIQIFNNWSPYMVRHPEHTVWLGLEYFCTENDTFWNMKEEDRLELAIQELKKAGILKKDTEVLTSHTEKVKKAYPAYFETYTKMPQIREYLDGFENLYCVGRNGQHRYNNMDHSVMTGFLAADNILRGATSRENIWNVNTEQNYQEENRNDGKSE